MGTLFSFHFCGFKYNLNNLVLEFWSLFFFRACIVCNLSVFSGYLITLVPSDGVVEVVLWLYLVSDTWTCVLNLSCYFSLTWQLSFKSILFKLLQLNTSKKGWAKLKEVKLSCLTSKLEAFILLISIVTFLGSPLSMPMPTLVFGTPDSLIQKCCTSFRGGSRKYYGGIFMHPGSYKCVFLHF